MVNDIKGNIKNLVYYPLLCSDLKEYHFKDLSNAIESSTSFLLDVDGKNRVAISWWVSAKRTRSYPYARVYNTLNYAGKRITIIPIFKDEGYDGDRDFIQFDTIALMSLLNVHVIVAYYINAEKNKSYDNKITAQRFDIQYIEKKIKLIISNQQSDALHWNMKEVEQIFEIGRTAIQSYIKIGEKLNIRMHDFRRAESRIENIYRERKLFITRSRRNARQAQIRESLTTQPKEMVDGSKGKITIENYLGGQYFFTVDETIIRKDRIFLIEAKHCKNMNKLPSIDDIKDGLLKMILYTNLEHITCNGNNMTAIPCLKLTNQNSKFDNISKNELQTLSVLEEEAKIINFQIIHE